MKAPVTCVRRRRRRDALLVEPTGLDGGRPALDAALRRRRPAAGVGGDGARPRARVLVVGAGTDLAAAGRRAGLLATVPPAAGPRDRRRLVRSRCATTARTSAEVAAAAGSPPRRWSRGTPAASSGGVLGFAPGFAYLTGLDPVLHVPRRDTPRTLGARRVGRGGRPVQRRLPARLARRLAAASAAPTAVLWDVGGRSARRCSRPARGCGSSDRAARRHERAARCCGRAARRPCRTSGGPGYAHLGVPRSGRAGRAAPAAGQPAGRQPRGRRGDRADARAACAVRADRPRGWRSPARRCPVPWTAARRRGGAVRVPAGGGVRSAAVTRGVRSYLAVRGGIAVEPVLGSRSTDSAVRARAGPRCGRHRAAARALPGLAGSGGRGAAAPPPTAVLRVLPGPRADWFARRARALCGRRYRVSRAVNRVGVRLGGPGLARRRSGELPQRGMVLGAVQVPPDGQPMVFLADHPTTGGYPVVGVVHPDRPGPAGPGPSWNRGALPERARADLTCRRVRAGRAADEPPAGAHQARARSPSGSSRRGPRRPRRARSGRRPGPRRRPGRAARGSPRRPAASSSGAAARR